MNLEELEASLPNGLHDAKLQCLDIDYVNQRASLLLSLLVGTPEASTREERETYRDARIELAELCFAAVDAPQKAGDFSKLRIDAGPGVASRSTFELPAGLPEDCFVHWIFVSEWNSFIHFAALDATITWVDEESG